MGAETAVFVAEEWFAAEVAADAAMGALMTEGAAVAGGALALGAADGLSGALGQALAGGFEGADMLAGAGATAADAGATAAAVTPEVASAGSNMVNEGIVSRSLTPAQAVLQGGKTSGLTAAEIQAAADMEVGAAPVAGSQAEVSAMNAAKQGNGFWETAETWAKANPTLATVAGTQVAGAVGGIGAGLLNQSTADKKIAADKDLLSQRTREQLALQQGTTAQASANSFKGKLGVSPKAGGQTLYRADGTPVYVPGSGLINNAMTP